MITDYINRPDTESPKSASSNFVIRPVGEKTVHLNLQSQSVCSSCSQYPGRIGIETLIKQIISQVDEPTCDRVTQFHPSPKWVLALFSTCSLRHHLRTRSNFRHMVCSLHCVSTQQRSPAAVASARQISPVYKHVVLSTTGKLPVRLIAHEATRRQYWTSKSNGLRVRASTKGFGQKPQAPQQKVFSGTLLRFLSIASKVKQALSDAASFSSCFPSSLYD